MKKVHDAKAHAKEASASTCVRCGLALETEGVADLLLANRDNFPIPASDLDVDVAALLGRSSADDQALLDAMARVPEIELPLMVERVRLQNLRGHVARAIEALGPSGDEGTQRARAELTEALNALSDLGVTKGEG